MKKRRLTKNCYISWDRLGYYAVTIIDLSYLTQRKLIFHSKLVGGPEPLQAPPFQKTQIFPLFCQKTVFSIL